MVDSERYPMTVAPGKTTEPQTSFRFVILTDTHINASDTVTASPWAVNRLANGRARAAVAAINAVAPVFAVHLGDVIHPLPGHNGYEAAAEKAKDILSGVNCPLVVVPGNHDVGDKRLSWSPAETVSDDFVAQFRKQYGDNRFRFEHSGCVFLGLDAQLINSDLPAETEQWSWFENALSEADGRRVFVLLHYPPFICSPDEHEHYDNIAEPGRSRLLELFSSHKVEACFSGHVHNFFYNLWGDTRLYTLPATSAVRHDYAGLFSIPPDDDYFGRDDAAKLGILVVDVDPSGHKVRFLRSHGQSVTHVETSPDTASGKPASQPYRIPFGSSRPGRNSFGATMRRNWCQVHEIAPSGAVDEFRRKAARDDHLLTAVWETGVGALRIPLDDLSAPERRARIKLLALDGFAVQVYCFDPPDGRPLDWLKAARDSLSAIEIILPSNKIREAAPQIAMLGRELGCNTIVSPLMQSGDDPGDHAFVHFISHGFAPGAAIPDYLAASGVNGIAFRIGHNEDPLTAGAACARAAREAGLDAHIHVATGDSNPARMDRNENRTTNRALLSLIAASIVNGPAHVWLDTLADVDRGYFPRLGLIDLRSNPRATATRLDELQRAIAASEHWEIAERRTDNSDETVVMTANERRLEIVLRALTC